VHSGHESSTQYFSCSGGFGAVSIKSVSGHVTPKLCFWIRWDLCAALVAVPVVIWSPPLFRNIS
jgi:hypothetical protein